VTNRPSVRSTPSTRAGARLLPQLPNGAAGGVAQLDPGRDQAVAHSIGELECPRGPQLSAKRDEVLDQRGQELPRIAQAARCRLAQPLNQ